MSDRSIQTQALSPQSEPRSVRRRRYATHRPARCAGRPPNGGALYDKRLESCFLDNISCGQQSEISLAEFEGCTDDGFAGAGDAIAMGSRHLFDQAVG